MPEPVAYQTLQTGLLAIPRTWLITSVAGFIGSNLLETLLKLGPCVVGLNNFATGHQRNLTEVQTLATPEQWAHSQVIQGDIRTLADCQTACEGVDHVLHQAALGSVPRSLQDPITTNAANITGFLNMLVAARDANAGEGVQSFTYAASSSTYGAPPGLPKVEDTIGKPLSPYAVTKYVNELYADVFARCYGFNTIGLRYLNVFGPWQDPEGAYVAVIPKWIASLVAGQPVYQRRQRNQPRFLLHRQRGAGQPAGHPHPKPRRREPGVQRCRGRPHQCQRVVCAAVHRNLLPRYAHPQSAQPVHRDFRVGDVSHSLVDIGKAQRLLGYASTQRIGDGLALAMPWYIGQQ